MRDWTKDDFAEFDRLTKDASSRDQMTRISARLDLMRMERELGIAAMNEMMEGIRKIDAGED